MVVSLTMVDAAFPILLSNSESIDRLLVMIEPRYVNFATLDIFVISFFDGKWCFCILDKDFCFLPADIKAKVITSVPELFL